MNSIQRMMFQAQRDRSRKHSRLLKLLNQQEHYVTEREKLLAREALLQSQVDEMLVLSDQMEDGPVKRDHDKKRKSIEVSLARTRRQLLAFPEDSGPRLVEEIQRAERVLEAAIEAENKIREILDKANLPTP